MERARLRQHLALHFLISISLFVCFAALDVHFTLAGTAGDLSLEGNPIMRFMMASFSHLLGLVLGKSLVFAAALLLAIVTVNGIHRRSAWVYYSGSEPHQN